MSCAADRSAPKPLPTSLGAVFAEPLPDDPAALKAMLRLLQGAMVAQTQSFDEALAARARDFEAAMALQTREFERRILDIYEQLRLARRRLFGPSAESHAAQGWLFDEADALAAEANSPAQSTTDTAELPPAGTPAAPASPAPRRGKRAPLAQDLPRVDVLHELPEAERTCACGTPMIEIGEEISEQLDIVPMQVRVLRHVRKRYGCPDGTHRPVSAAAPAQVLPKSNASSDLLAMLLTTKYVDGLPLARFEFVLARAGVRVPRQTLARWVIGAARALQPVANLMRDALLEASVIHMDETTVQVLKEADRAATSQSYMWVQRGGPPDKPVVLFDYDPSRSGAVPQRLLAGWQGYLMTDGYSGYNALVAKEQITHLSCWTHARRRFVEAAQVLPKGKRGRAAEAVEFIGQLYGIEREIRELPTLERFAVRQARSLPVLGALRQWLDDTLQLVPPSSKLGEALDYLHAYWPKLIRYTERGDLPIDNNAAENAIRPFVVGRKAWLFSDTPAGAHASALIYSLIETAKANGLEPYTWLRRVLRKLPEAITVDDFEALLPWKLKAADLATESIS